MNGRNGIDGGLGKNGEADVRSTAATTFFPSCRQAFACALGVLAFWAASVASTRGQAGGPASSAGCEAAGRVKFVCGQNGPEDLVLVPGTPWLVASSFGGDGGLYLIDTKAASSSKIFPTASAAARWDRTLYADCPGLPSLTPRFQTHGLFLTPGRAGRHTLLVVYHGTRESVEVFELDARGATASVTWVGCVVAPGLVGLNSVMALPQGGFIATNFQSRNPSGRGGGFSQELVSGQNNGELWEWHAGKGWAKVPGSEAAGANGLEMSRDGKWLYVAQWGNKSLMRLSRGPGPAKRDVLDLGFRVDNLRWAPDGTLLVAGQGGPDCAVLAQARGQGPCNGVPMSTIGRVDTETWTYTPVVDVPTTPVIAAATVAVEVGGELWSGSFRGDRVMRFPATGLK